MKRLSTCYLLPRVLRAWAKVGQTPPLRTPRAMSHLSVANAITLQGRLIAFRFSTVLHSFGGIYRTSWGQTRVAEQRRFLPRWRLGS